MGRTKGPSTRLNLNINLDPVLVLVFIGHEILADVYYILVAVLPSTVLLAVEEYGLAAGVLTVTEPIWYKFYNWFFFLNK